MSRISYYLPKAHTLFSQQFPKDDKAKKYKTIYDKVRRLKKQIRPKVQINECKHPIIDAGFVEVYFILSLL